jgi:hypothetical protein
MQWLDPGQIHRYHVRFEVFTAATMKNPIFWEVMPCGSCKNWRFRGRIAYIIRVTRIGLLGTMLVVTSKRSKLRKILFSPFLSPWRWRRYVHPKRRFLQEPCGITSQKTAFLNLLSVFGLNVSMYSKPACVFYSSHFICEYMKYLLDVCGK